MAGLILVCAAAIPGELSDEYHLDLRGMRAIPRVLQPVVPQMIEWIHPDAEGVRVTLPADRESLLPLSLATRLAVRGDFEITASYQILDAEVPKSGFGVGVVVQIKKAKPSVGSASIGWVVRAQGKHVAVWDLGMMGPEGKYRKVGGEAATSAQTGRLRLQRVGDNLSYLLAKGASRGEFEEIHQAKFGAEDLGSVLLQVVTSRQPRAIDMRWLDFKIRAERVAQSLDRGHVSLFWPAVVTIVSLGGGIWQWQRWRRRYSLQNSGMASTRQVRK